MKKLLLTFVAMIAFCGSIFAQYPSEVYDFHYTINDSYGDFDYIIPFIQIDGEYLSLDDNYEAFELAAFIDGECRGASFLIDDGEDYPFTEISVFRPDNAAEQEISFKLWDHENEIEYIGTNTLLNGPNHIYYMLYTTGDYDDVPVLTFTVGGFTRDITPYTEPEGKDNYCLIATPVGAKAASEVTNLTSNSYDLYTYDQAASDGLEWINHRGEEGFELVPGVGYLYANSGDGEHDVVTLNFGSEANPVTEYSFTLVNAENTDFPNDGWNLLGNPFGVDATIGTEKPFFTMVEGALVPQDAGTPIPAMEGFFVNAVGETGLTETVTIIPAEGGSKAPMFALNLSNGGKVIDRAIVSFGKGQQLPKFQIFKNSTKVYIPMDGNDYALVRSEGMGEMPVNFKAESNGTYSLSLNTEDVDFAYLHLIDNLTGVEQDMLANPSYSFSANTTDYASRFRLVFATGSQEESFAFFSNGSLFINNEGNATLQVVDVTGRIIKCENINGCASVNINAAPGVYMVRLINGDNMKVQKVVK